MDINLDLYKVFCVVARQGNLSRAAAELFVSQSAVSQSIKQLETQLGGRLFNRNARGVTLTSEGEMLFSYADRAYSMLESAEQQFQAMKTLKAGTVRIGASDTVCSLVLIDVLNRYHQRYPDIRIQLTNSTSGGLIDLLKRGRLDMTFVNLPLENDSGLKVQQIAQINDCFVVGGKYGRLARRTMNLKELETYPVMTLDKTSSSRRIMDEFLRQKGVHIQPAIEMGSVELLLDFAKIGLGISIVTEQAAAQALQNGALQKLHLSEPIPKRGIGLVTVGDTAGSFAAQRLIDMLNPAAGTMQLC